MKAAIASVVTAVAASVCCIGPLLAVTIGGSALVGATVAFEPYRPIFIVVTVLLIAWAVYRVHGPAAEDCAPGSPCAPASRRRAKWMVWSAAALALLLVTFPYYVEWLV